MAGPALRTGTGLRQSQRLALTPSLRHALQVLGLSAADLAGLIAAEIESNPVLEQTAPLAPGRSGGESFEIAARRVARADSVAEILRRQISELTRDRELAEIASFLAADLTESGFLPDSARDLAALLGRPEARVRAAITLLQRCDPPGIGARDLAECLDLQLKRRGTPPETRRLLLENLPLFAARDWKALERRTGMRRDALRRLAALLRELHPNPRALIEPEEPQFLFPDVRVRARPEGGFEVESLNPAETALSIDESLLERAGSGTAETDRYLQARRARALDLIRALQARRRTVLRVTREIVLQQHRFFADGPEHLRPMTRQALAGVLGLHPSTVGRAIANKALECAHGLYPLGFFFTAPLRSRFGEEVSSRVVQREIRRLIDGESPEDILSDARIAAILRQSGVDIARRTVAKYRQCLKLPSSAQRRRSKTLL